jgi:hypothetical protein
MTLLERDRPALESDYLHAPKLASVGQSIRPRRHLLKWYEVAPATEPIEPMVSDLARLGLADAARLGELRLGGTLGFVILHRCGEGFHFLLLCTWQNENELWGDRLGEGRRPRPRSSTPGRSTGRTGRPSASGSWASSRTSATRGRGFSALRATATRASTTCANTYAGPCSSVRGPRPACWNTRGMSTHAPDTDPVETQEWLDSVDAVVDVDGRLRWRTSSTAQSTAPRTFHVPVSAGVSTPYVNTIPTEDEPEMPGDPELEAAATALVRWNAIAIVLQANAESTELGGHIASYQSAETLYEVGFNHFWRRRTDEHGGDLVYMQGHSSPGSTRAPSSRAGSARRAAPLPAGGRRRRALVVPAPVADARVLAVPDRLDGARAR